MISEIKVKSQGGGGAVMRAGALIRSKTVYDKAVSDDDWEKLVDIFRDSGNCRFEL